MRWLGMIALGFPLAALAQAPDFTRLVREQGAAVVNIDSAYAAPAVLPDLPHDEFLLPDFDRLPLGSGFLIRSDGYILTNYHVVEDAFNEEVVVRLSDGRELVGRVAGVDPETDIALVKVQAAALPQVRIGDPKKLQAGEWVATIGSPFGLERSLAAGGRTPGETPPARRASAPACACGLSDNPAPEPCHG